MTGKIVELTLIPNTVEKEINSLRSQCLGLRMTGGLRCNMARIIFIRHMKLITFYYAKTLSMT